MFETGSVNFWVYYYAYYMRWKWKTFCNSLRFYFFFDSIWIDFRVWCELIKAKIVQNKEEGRGVRDSLIFDLHALQTGMNFIFFLSM
jgi:hypothetical protein